MLVDVSKELCHKYCGRFQIITGSPYPKCCRIFRIIFRVVYFYDLLSKKAWKKGRLVGCLKNSPTFRAHPPTHPLFESQVKKRVPPKRGTGPRRCVHTNPPKHTKSYSRPRASKKKKRNTNMHLRDPEKLVLKLRVYMKKHDDETGGHKRNRCQL